MPGPSSSHSAGEPQSVNPYEASAAGADGIAPRQDGGPWRFRLRVTWADRRRFLRAVVPLRVYATCGAAMAGWAVVTLLSTLGQIWSDPDGRTTVVLALRVALSVAFGGTVIYACVLTWRLADAISAAMGGRTAEMRHWSHLQLRMAYVALALLLVNLAGQAFDWFLGYYLVRMVEMEL
jgi:hypothetical protein